MFLSCCFFIGVPFFPLAAVVMNHHAETAYQPSGRIAQSDINNRVNEPGTDKQIQLTEEHETCQHNEHRSCRVARTAQRTTLDRVFAAEDVKRAEEPDKDAAIIQHIVVLGEQQQHLPREDQQ